MCCGKECSDDETFPCGPLGCPAAAFPVRLQREGTAAPGEQRPARLRPGGDAPAGGARPPAGPCPPAGPPAGEDTGAGGPAGFAGGPGDDQLATQAELDRWNDLIATAPVVRMDFNDMHQEEKDLSVEQEQEILDALRGAALELYPPDHRENPVTGGGYTVVAYDGEENVLFKAIYIGNWFTVQFGTEKARYIFDGEGTTLNDIYARGW